MSKKLSVKDLLSIEVHLDTGDEDKELEWFSLFVKTPDGIECQFGDRGSLDSDAELRIVR